MADNFDDSTPMLEREQTDTDAEHPPKPTEGSPATPEDTPTTDATAADTADKQETVVPQPASPDREVSVLPADGSDNHVSRSNSTLSTGTLGPKPVKPPRLKSMRSKESPPLLHVKPVDDAPDVEAALPGTAGDSSVVESKPPVPEVTIQQPEPQVTIQQPEPEIKLDDVERKPYEPTTAPLLPSQHSAVKPKKKFGLDYIMNNKWIILGAIAIVLVILIIIIVSVTVSRKPPPEPPVPVEYEDPVVYSLRCGEAFGSWKLNYSVAAFKGIPYLRPPVGNLRWSYNLEFTDPNDCGNRTSNEFRGPCFQLNETPGTNETYIGSEDCLYMNIWTPALAPEDSAVREKLPVLVYIHGGFLHFGSGHEEVFADSAHRLAKELNAVVVSFNYRLNVFGWLALKKLETATSLSGNYGLYDQIAALKWIKEYISSFGGDPAKVTVAGASSGGTSILALLTNAEARDTFQRAWISGASSKFDDAKDATYQTNADVYLRNIGCQSKAQVKSCLLAKTREELVDAIPWIQYPSWAASALIMPPMKDEFIGAILINDGIYVAEKPSTYLSTDNGLQIPLLIGNAEYESDRYQVVPGLSDWSWGQYSDYIRSRLDTLNDTLASYVLQEYAQEHRNNPRLHMAALISDLRSICPQTFIARDIQDNQKGSNVYRYVMTANTPQDVSDKYLAGSSVSTHGTDVTMFFHYSDKDSKAYKETKSHFRALLKEFMIKGSISNWQRFPKVYNITSNSAKLTDRWTSEDCKVWEGYYPDYSWMN